MTKATRTRVCRWCGEPVPDSKGPGRPAAYCRRSHRQRAFEARLEGRRRKLGPGDVVISGRLWEALRDALYRLEAAAEDVALDVAADRSTKADYIEAFAHLSEAIRGLLEVSVEPTAVGEEW